MMQLAELIEVELKNCPRCEESLPVSEFGICRARKDGLNLYCKRCIRQKIAHSRARLREYKAARIKAQAANSGAPLAKIQPSFTPRRIARLLRKLSPSDRVREAIALGAHTQKEIVSVTKLPKDEVCDSLANLLLWTREIRTQIVNHKRLYFINEAMQPLANSQSSINRKQNIPASFSSVGALMPGKTIQRKEKLA